MWFFNKLPSHLPFGEGKYIPGAIDLMTEYDINGVFLRMYYPTNLKGQITDYSKHWIPWVKGSHYIKGFSKVSFVSVIVVRFVLWLYSGRAYIPIVYDAKPKTDSTLKCIIFSHGLGATRFLYSAICVDLASRGFLVACIEHRDRSACSSYFYDSEVNARKDIKTFIEHMYVDFGAKHYSVRNEQVTYRSKECVKVVNLLHQINNGKPPVNILENVPNRKLVQFQFELLENQLDLSNLTIMGHSFGAATSLLTLCNEPRIKQGVLLDPWMFPIKDVRNITELVIQPLIFVNTQTFHVESNVNAMEKYLRGNKRRCMYTLLHTTHECQCDSPFVAGYWLNWFMKKLPPITALRINNHLVFRFLNEQVGVPESIDETEKFLQSQRHNIIEGLTKPWVN